MENVMKRSLIALVTVASFTAHAGWFGSDEKKAPEPKPHPYAMKTAAPAQAFDVPAWCVRLPEDTPEMVFKCGQGTHKNWQMAMDKAIDNALAKLCMLRNGQVNTRSKNYRLDSGENFQERFESTTQKYAECDVVGTQRVDSQTVMQGDAYVTFVLVRYPLGPNNVLRKELEVEKLKKETELRSGRAHEDLDALIKERTERQDQVDQRQREQLGPRSDSRSTATVPTAQGELKLLDVDNTEYQRRRAEALTKPGAVIGNTVIQTN